MSADTPPQLFDRFAANYDEGHARAVKASGFSVDYFHDYKIKEILRYLTRRRYDCAKLKILNFGCGVGKSERYIRQYFPDSMIYGVDVSGESIKVAQQNNKLGGVTYAAFDGANIPFDMEFDVILAAGVFHHIPRAAQSAALAGVYKRLKPGGFLFIFELNPLNPATLWVAYRNDYRFDKDARLLTPFYMAKIVKSLRFSARDIRYTVFFPAFLSFMLPMERWLAWLPAGAHYYFAGRKEDGR